MGYSHSELVAKFKAGAIKGEASHLYIEGDTMYSYGRHFPLLVRREWGNLLNADKYSGSTSSHQSCASSIATIQVPFSALRNARIPYREFNLVAHDPARYDLLGYSTWDTVEQKTKHITVREYLDLPEEEQLIYSEVNERRPEAAILEYQGHYYLSSMDGPNYFICELPKPAQTTAQAFEMLIPEQVKDREYTRQGEWFFTKAETLPIAITKADKELTLEQISKMFYKAMAPGYTLPHRDNGNPHTATRGDNINGIHYVSGQVRHPEHRTAKLSFAKVPVIFEAYENTALNSWSAGGGVD